MMTEQEVAIRIICAFLGALCIINMFTKVIGPERKQQWFTVRSGWFVFLNYRGSKSIFKSPFSCERRLILCVKIHKGVFRNG